MIDIKKKLNQKLMYIIVFKIRRELWFLDEKKQK